MNNLDYFNLSVNHKEPLINEKYFDIVNHCIIPATAEIQNELTKSNQKLVRYISTIETYIYDLNIEIDDARVEAVIKLIIKELQTDGMDYSAFSQFFNTHNLNYGIIIDLEDDEKIMALKYLIKSYIDNRHHMYLSHGYSDIVLQVISDCYSHKRKGMYGTYVITEILKGFGVQLLNNSCGISDKSGDFYLLSDKGGKLLFNRFADDNGICLSGPGRKTKKYPDALIKIGNDYFIVEQKNMKENGGGQDKQLVEIIRFIDKKPEINNLHYVTFVDGIYFNQINESATGKINDSFSDIIQVLKEHKENYFVNTFGFKKLIEDYKKQKA